MNKCRQTGENFYQMLSISSIKKDPILLLCCKCDCHVGLRSDIQRFHFDVGRIVKETQTGQVLAAFACKKCFFKKLQGCDNMGVDVYVCVCVIPWQFVRL